MEPSDFVRVLGQRWKIIVAALVIAGAAAWITTPATPQFGPPVVSYTASATLLQEPGADVSLPFVALLATKGRIPTVAAETLGYTEDPALLASTVSVVPDTEVGTLTFTTGDTDGDQAATVANAFADATITVLAQDAKEERQAQIAELQSSITENQANAEQVQQKLDKNPDDILLGAQLSAYQQQLTAATSELVALYGQAGSGADLSVLQEATPIPIVSGGGFAPPSSRKGRLVLGLAVGFLLGLLLVLVMDRLDTKLRRREDVEEAYRLPVVAEIPRVPRRHRKRTVDDALRNPAGPIAGAYRSLRTSLALLPSRPLAMPTWNEGAAATVDLEPAAPLPESPQVILVTSARASEGKSTTTAMLAATMAETGRRVLVIDADFHNPSMHKLLDVTPGPGLADLLALESESELELLTRPTGWRRIRLLTAGESELHRGVMPARIALAVAEARDYADIVIIDAAPVLHTNDALDFTPFVDTVVVVARLGKVTRAQASRVTDLLGRTRVPVLGVVAIGGRRGSGGYGYGQYKTSEPSRMRRRHASRAAKEVTTP